MSPTFVIDALQGVRRKVKLFSVLFGVGIVVCAVAAALLATVLLDYLLNLPPVPRLVVVAAALAGIGYVLARWVVRPMFARLGLSDMAGKLEHAFPAFDDRLRSTVDFAMKGTPGSDVMKDRVISQATELVKRFNLGSAVEVKPIWYSASAAGGAVLFLMLLASLVGRDYLTPAFERLFSPFAGHVWPERVEIQMVGNLPQRVPAGGHVDVRMRLSKGDYLAPEARIHYDYGDGHEEEQIMTRGTDGIYSTSLDARGSAAGGNGIMKIWIGARDDTTTPLDITVVPRLAVTHIELDVTAPPYVAGHPQTVADLGAAPVTVTYGSTLALKVSFNKDLDSHHPLTLTAARQGKLPEVKWDAAAGPVALGQWVADGSVTFQIHATDIDGFPNPDMTDYQLIVQQDQMPSVQITNPLHNDECTPVAVVPLRGIAEDDFGIDSMKLMIFKLGEKSLPLTSVDLVKNGRPVNGVTWAALDSAGDRHRWQIDYPWDLAHVDAAPLKPGDVIEYYLQVRDNFALDGKYHDPVDSGKLRITILSQEQLTEALTNGMEQLRQQVVDIRNNQQSLKTQTNDLRRDTEKQGEFNKADRAQAQQLIAGQATAAAQTKQVAGKLDDLLARMEENKSNAQDLKEIATGVKDDLNQAAEHPMKDAAGQIDDAKNQQPDPKSPPADQKQSTDQRNGTLDKAQDNQQVAVDTLDKAAARMGEVGGLSKAIQQLKDILDQQNKINAKSDEVGLKNLGKRPEQMDPKDQADQKKNADDQARLADKTQKAIDGMMAQSKQTSKSDPASSKAMEQAAKTGQEQNVPSQMQESAEQQKSNQQSAAQQAQSQVEIGLQMMIRQLEEAQNRKLAELAAQLADMKEQLQALIRLQAGLNYDNMDLQGGQVLAKADPKLVDKLIDQAERTKGHLPPTADMGTQTRLQEQNEHNARNVAKTAQALPDGSNVEAEISRAADRMGRAITYLRDDAGQDAQRLASAYDPPQVDALAALEKAQKIVTDALQKAQDTIAQQKKDAIRAAYEKILDAQKKIDADTQALDKAPKNPDGQLGHADNLRLGKLPTDQGDLADRTSKLEDDLNAVGSIVYVWANKDIVDSMNGVKQQLAKPDTGVVAQTEQTRIEEQLAAMIDSLKSKPKDPDKFVKPPEKGGKGSGKSPPPQLPTEAELRLLKSLQQAINKSTVKLSQQPVPDKPVITALGGRQGKIRDLLGQLLDKASHGKIKLGPEPDKNEKLPEEATTGDLDNQELDHALLNDDGQPDGDQVKQDASLIGQRLGRSRQRLAQDNDPGKVTQEIQKRILQNMDALIEMARAQQQQGKPQPGSGQPGEPKPGDADAQGNPNNSDKQGKPGEDPNAGKTPAQTSADGHDVDTNGTPTQDIAQAAAEWGKNSPRNRKPLIEAATEKPIGRFKTLIDEYYRALGTRATETDQNH